MSSRKIKVNGVMTKFSFDKNKKYKYNSSGDVVEATVIHDDDIVLSGSKSSLRRMSDMERNISILATKTVTTAGDLDVSISEVDGLQTALNEKATPGDISTSLNSAKSYTDTKVADLVSSAPGTLNTLNELAAALGDDPNFATTITNSIASRLPTSGGAMSGSLTVPGALKITEAGTAQVLMMGNQDSAGSNKPAMVMGVNGQLRLGYGNSWSGEGGTFTSKLTVGSDGVKHNGTDLIFHNGYHPNADKWTTARTLSLSGDASGSVSWDGSANATLSVTVANDSHTHDTRYMRTDTQGLTSNINTIASKSAVVRWNNATTGRPASGQSNEYGPLLQMAYDGTYVSQLAHDFAEENLYFRSLATNTDTPTTWKKLFHDTYHPNADKWTTARTLSLSGDASGSVSWDGSGNATLNVTVGSDSHNHNHSDGGFTVNGNLVVTGDVDVGSQIGTWLQSDVMSDAIGWNSSYGVYIGSNIGGTHYLRGNGTFSTDGSTYNLWHSGNDGVGSGLDADSIQGYTPQETPVNNSIVKRDGGGNIQVNYLNATRINNTDVKEGSFTVGGDANTYYPVTWWGGNQDIVTEIEIYRSYSSTAPNTWNTSTHKGGLTFKISTNFGGWGGSNYDETVYDFRQTYSNMVADYTRFGSNRGFCVWLRGGGATYSYKIKGRSSAPTVTLGAYDPGGNNTGVTSRTDAPHTNINNNFIVTKNNGNFTASVTVSGSITATGDVTAYSDDSLKTNIQTIDGALDRVGAVRGVTYDRIEDGSTSTGVVAQELQQVLPEAVHTDDNGIQHVAYGNISGLLIEAVKELKSIVESQAAEIAKLKKD